MAKPAKKTAAKTVREGSLLEIAAANAREAKDRLDDAVAVASDTVADLHVAEAAFLAAKRAHATASALVQAAHEEYVAVLKESHDIAVKAAEEVHCVGL